MLIVLSVGKYSCRTENDCVVNCLNIPDELIYYLKNFSSEWIPVLQNDGNCYLYNKITEENIKNDFIK